MIRVALFAETCNVKLRAALKQFDDTEVLYLVANIQSIDGADFQAQMGLPNVSLVMFDAQGDRVAHVHGVTPRAELEQTFRAQLNLEGQS